MRFPRIALAHANVLQTCPAVENGRPCVNNPRWIEEDWSAEALGNLTRAHNDLGSHFDAFSREERILRSKAVVHAHVCVNHSTHSKRLHTLQMIRGDARSDLRGPRFTKRKPARGRKAVVNTAKKTARIARQPSIERGRGGEEPLPEYFASELENDAMSIPPPASPSTPAPGYSSEKSMAGPERGPKQLQTPQPTPDVGSRNAPTLNYGAVEMSDNHYQLETPSPTGGHIEAKESHVHGKFREMGRSRSLDRGNNANCARCALLEAQGQLHEQRITDLERINTDSLQENAALRAEVQVLRDSNETREAQGQLHERRIADLEQLNTDVLQENAELREDAQVLRNNNEKMARGLVLHATAMMSLAGH